MILSENPLLHILEFCGQGLGILVSVIEIIVVGIGLVDPIGPLEEEFQMGLHIVRVGEEIGKTEINQVGLRVFDEDIPNRDVGVCHLSLSQSS